MADTGLCNEQYSHAREGKKSVLAWRYKLRAAVAVSRMQKAGCERPAVLDMGCADGLTLLEMQRRLKGGHFRGVEYSESLASIARSKGLNVFHGDVCKLPDDFTENSLDVVTALAVLEHLPHPELAGREAFRVLKPGGILIASCPDPKWEAVSKKVGLFKEDNHHCHFKRETFEWLAAQSALELESYSKFMSALFGFLPYLKIYFPSVMSQFIDELIHSVRIFDWCFVNQIAVLRKPKLPFR